MAKAMTLILADSIYWGQQGSRHLTNVTSFMFVGILWYLPYLTCDKKEVGRDGDKGS